MNKLRKPLSFAGILGIFIAISLYFGDTLWDVVAPPTPTLPPQAAATSTPRPTSTPPVDEVISTAVPSPPAQDVRASLPVVSAADASVVRVWIPQSGSRYHLTETCSGMKSAQEVTLEQAKTEGFTPCKRCNPPE